MKTSMGQKEINTPVSFTNKSANGAPWKGAEASASKIKRRGWTKRQCLIKECDEPSLRLGSMTGFSPIWGKDNSQNVLRCPHRV